MPPPGEIDRPATVAWIGGVYLVVSILFAAKSAFNLILFVSLRPTVPMLLQTFGGSAAAARLEPLLPYFPALVLAQIAGWIFVAVAAVAFLRLRPWARRALRVVAWVNLAYITCVLALFLFLPRQGDTVGPSVRRTFVFGIAILVAIAAGLVALIVSLGSARVRSALSEPARPEAPTRT